MIRPLLTLLLALSLALPAWAEDAVVIVKNETQLDYRRSDKGLTIPYYVHVRKTYRLRLNAAALPWPQENNKLVYDSAAYRNLRIAVSVHYPDGSSSRIKKMVPYRPDVENAFSSDMRGYHYRVEKLVPGTEIEETLEYDDYELVTTSSVHLRTNGRTEQVKVDIRYPAELQVKVHPFNLGADFAVTETPGKYSLANRQALPQQSFDDDGLDEHYQPWLLLQVRGYTAAGKFTPLFDSPGHLRDWYTGIYNRQYRPSWDSIPQAFVDSLYKGAITPWDKLERANTWVQKNIKYVAFFDGDQGWIPHSPVRVYNQRFGDCKGMSSLLHCLVKRAGIKTTLALVGTRDIALQPDSFASPRCFNHMICLAYPDTTQPPVVLDATSSLLLLGQVPDRLQDKLVLAVSGPQVLLRLPQMQDDYSGIRDTIDAVIEGDAIVYKVRSAYYGYCKDFNYALHSAQTQEQQKKWMQQVLMQEATNASCQVHSLELNERNDRPLRINYTLTIPHAITRQGDRLYFKLWKPLSTSKVLFAQNIPEDRIAPYMVDYRMQSTQLLSLAVPKGYQVVSSAEAQHLSVPTVFDFRQSLTLANDKLLASSTFRQQALMIKPELFNQYRKTFSQVKQAAGTSLVLQATKP